MRLSESNPVNRQRRVKAAEAEQLLRDLVNIPSISCDEGVAVRHLVDWMKHHGYNDTYVDEAGNAIGIIGSGSRDIVLLGHIDTFGGNPEVRQEGRLLFGRGTVDAKGPLSAFAVSAANATLPSDIRIIVIGAVEEEAASSKGARHIATSFNPEACVIGEPSQWDRITLGYKGRLVINWSWRGPLAHSAGVTMSPGEHAVDYWQQVQQIVAQINRQETRVFHQLDATLQEINTTQDGAYGEAHMTIGFRIPPALTAQAVFEKLHSPPTGNIRPHGMELPHVANKDTHLSRVFRGAIRKLGGKPRFVHKTGTSDMNVVAPIWNCPILAYGPGDSALDHTPDEHIDLDEYAQSIEVLTQALGKL